MSIPHNCIGPGRSNRTNEDRGLFRGRGCANPWRSRIRFTVRSDGGSTPTGQVGGNRRNNSIRIRFAPHRGCRRRTSATAASPRRRPDADTTTDDATGPPTQPPSPPDTGPPNDATSTAPPHTGRDLDHTLPRQHRPNRVQPLLNNRQHNQRHPGSPIRNNAPQKRQRIRIAESGPHCRASPGAELSHITRHRTLTARSVLLDTALLNQVLGRAAATHVLGGPLLAVARVEP